MGAYDRKEKNQKICRQGQFPPANFLRGECTKTAKNGPSKGHNGRHLKQTGFEPGPESGGGGNGLNEGCIREYDSGCTYEYVPSLGSPDLCRHVRGGVDNHRPDDENQYRHVADEKAPLRIVTVKVIQTNAAFLSEPTCSRYTADFHEEAKRFRCCARADYRIECHNQ